jgi:hypothetical protein
MRQVDVAAHDRGLEDVTASDVSISVDVTDKPPQGATSRCCSLCPAHDLKENLASGSS